MRDASEVTSGTYEFDQVRFNTNFIFFFICLGIIFTTIFRTFIYVCDNTLIDETIKTYAYYYSSPKEKYIEYVARELESEFQELVSFIDEAFEEVK